MVTIKGQLRDYEPAPFKDSDLMPFGEHKDEKIGDVPADYLLWFAEQPWAMKYPRLLAYVNLGKNKEWLIKEANSK